MPKVVPLATLVRVLQDLLIDGCEYGIAAHRTSSPYVRDVTIQNTSTACLFISGGAAGCWSLTNLAPRILKRNFDPGFFVEHFIKDMGIALEEARRMDLCLPGLALVHQLYLSVAANGGGRSGTQALMLALESMSQVEVRPSA